MNQNKIAIVCDGKEISYGMNLLHLFRYKSEKESFLSDHNAGMDIEIFSLAAYRHANISKKTVKVFIGEVQGVTPSMNPLFCQYGMTVWGTDSEIVLKADAKVLTGEQYEKFIAFANKKRMEYFELEKEYVRKAEARDGKWIAKEFEQAVYSGLPGRKNSLKAKMKQQYDCMAFVLYLDYLHKEKR